MDIHELITREAPRDNAHDKAFAKELEAAYLKYKDKHPKMLENEQEYLRRLQGGLMPTHRDIAQLTILYELINEKEK